jgi:hypothetical protein
LILDSELYGITTKSVPIDYVANIEKYLAQSAKLESDKQRLRRILKLQVKYYDGFGDDKVKAKELNKEIKTLNKEIRNYIKTEYH